MVHALIGSHIKMKKIYNILFKILSVLALLPIKVYQYCISPYFPPSCRFIPSCSHYGAEAIKKHGPFKGLYLTIRRILKCHPWGGSGYDPVPEETHTNK